MTSSFSSQHTSAGPVLVYDGACGFCAESVRLVLEHDKKKLLRFASRDGDFGRGVLQRHPELADVDSVLWVVPAGGELDAEVVLTRSDAALQVAAYLGGAWRTARAAHLLPRWLRDAAYQLVANHRHRLRAESCLTPTAEERTRFLP